MAVHTVKWVKNNNGTPARIQTYPEAATQTFKRGDFVVWDTSDEKLKAAVDTTVAAIGIADQDASGTTSTLIHVLVPQPGDIFSATISSAGANGTAHHDLKTVGKNYSWLKSTESGETTKTTIDIADTSNAWVTIVDLDPRDAAATSGGRVLFTILPAVYDVGAVA
jgi:hypothetical protein